MLSYPAQPQHIHNQAILRGVLGLKTYIEERAVEVAKFMITTNATVRETAKKFGISKSTVHKDDGVIIGTVKGSAKKP